MPAKSRNTPRFLLSVFFLAGAVLACNLGFNNAGDDKQATAQAIASSVRSTATAAAAASSGGSEQLISTVQAEATLQNQSIVATQTSLANSSSEEQSATATAVAPILAELPKYDVDPSLGQVGWVHPPVTLDIEGYAQYDYANQFLNTVAADFIVSADITWNTSYGSSGCGFVLRSDGNQDALNQYMVIASRGASGHVAFATMADGEIVTGQDIYAYGIDPNFDWQNDATNRLTVVGRGNRFLIYTNGKLIGEIDPGAPPPQPSIPPPPQIPIDTKDTKAMEDYLQKTVEYKEIVTQIKSDHSARVAAFKTADTQFDRGFIAMVALSESGHTVCQFNNAWLWLIE